MEWMHWEINLYNHACINLWDHAQYFLLAELRTFKSSRSCTHVKFTTSGPNPSVVPAKNLHAFSNPTTSARPFPAKILLMAWVGGRVGLGGLCLNNTVQKDSRGVLGTTFRFGRLSENYRQISNMADWAFKAGIKEAEKQGFYCTLHPIHVQCLFKHEIGVELFNVFEKNFC